MVEINPKTNRHEIRKNRFLIFLLVIFGVITFMMGYGIWYDVSPQDALGKFTYKVQYTNASTVYITQDLVDLLNTRYKSDDGEFIYCLHGGQYEDGYLINEFRETEVNYADAEVIAYTPCRRVRGYLGTVHSHPQPKELRVIATCEMSKQDLYTFGSEKQALTGIICGENKVAFYGIDNLEESFQIKVIQED